MSVMALTLVIGPANSAKAGEVLGAYAAAAPRGALLVVPTALDAEHYLRELTSEGALLGSVLTFGGLAAEIARRSGFGAARVTELQRERLLTRAIRDARLERLAEAAGSPGFLTAAGALIAELQRSLITPARLAQALRLWAGADADRVAYGREVAAVYFAYRRALDRAGRLDSELYAWQALDALRAAPGRWGASPVFFYGFDDLHPLQRDAIETLAALAGAEVTVSLTYEPGRTALGARAEAVEELRPLAERVLELPPADEYYAPSSRTVLHHLERHLFEPEAGRVDAAGVVGLLEAGGARAEAELLAAEILGLQRGGIDPGEVALVLRSPERGAPVLMRVLAQYGIGFAVELGVPLGHTALGRGLLALARCALSDPDATPAGELIAYLRTPGMAADRELVDRLEAEIARAGVLTVRGARERTTLRLEELDALRAAGDPLDALGSAARHLLTGGDAGRAPVLDAVAEQDARACGAVLSALAELRELEPGIAGPELIEQLERLSVPAGAPTRPGAVLITDPLSIRARRFRAVLVAGLGEGEFPLAGTPEPFLPDELRHELAVASGLRLRPREDGLARERYLLYACISRATDRVVLSYRSSDEEGNLSLPSPFLRDVGELLDTGWWERRRRRLLADVVWTRENAPTERERRRAEAAAVAPAAGAGEPGGERVLSPAALAHVRHREILSAGALESYAECPVKWLVDRQLQPEALEPTSEPMARGSFMHDTLERVLRELGERVTPATLPRALELLDGMLTRLPADLAPGSPPGVRAAALRMIAADLRRYLEHEARQGGGEWQPVRFEQRFGFDDDEDSLPALELGAAPDGEGVRVRGAIDRIDVDPSGRRAVVRDYKSGSVRQEFQAGRWALDGRLQVALYMLAVRELLGLEPVAGLYQPLRGGELRARGVHLHEADVGDALYPNDGREPDELGALLDEARARALVLAARLRSGALEPCPSTCSRDGCRHPGICRSA